MTEREKLQKAQEKFETLMAFYIHLAVFVVVMTMLFVLNATAGKVWWVQWPLLGWGFGVLIHGFAVFGKAPDFFREWQLRKIYEIKESM